MKVGMRVGRVKGRIYIRMRKIKIRRKKVRGREKG